MKCETCVNEGKTSRVFPEGGYETLMYCSPYYDEQGKLHHHDMNTCTYGYHCSNGHRWHKSVRKPCPTCGDNW